MPPELPVEQCFCAVAKLMGDALNGPVSRPEHLAGTVKPYMDQVVGERDPKVLTIKMLEPRFTQSDISCRACNGREALWIV